jgi:hypothetical protein
MRRNFLKRLQNFPEFSLTLALSTDWIIPQSLTQLFSSAHLNHNRKEKVL